MTETQLATASPQTLMVNGGPAETSVMSRVEAHPAWPLLSRLPMVLTAAVSIKEFKVRDLLTLKEGQVILSDFPQGNDLPLAVGDVVLGWGEFEVIGQQIGVRVIHLM